MNNDPAGDALAAGFQAILRGDAAERDRQVERARQILDAQEAIPKVDIGPKEIVTRLLRMAEHELGRPLTAAERGAIEQDPAGLLQHLIDSGYKMPI